MKQQKLEKLPDEGNVNFIPHFTITRKLGKGGMAIVFEAEHDEWEDPVAIKVLQPIHNHSQLEVTRFQREAELLIQFEHENIVQGYESGETAGLHWFAMEKIDGQSVQDILDRTKFLDEDRALYVIVHAAKALDYCQQQGILHRDIKPENLMVTPEGRIVLCDLGFAKNIDGSDAEDEDTTCGTVQYISPEQARGIGDVDIRSDIYSLGATLWHLVVGEVPFKGDESMEVMAKHVLDELENPAALSENVTAHLSYFLMKMMAKDREIRYQSPQELVDDIESQILGKKTMDFNPDGQSTADNIFSAPQALEEAEPVAQPVSPRRTASSGRRRATGSGRRGSSSSRRRRR
ncbi:MAG: serine/threonine protein kinase [Planctomycetota bacterium]|jgi:serine/threonine-protein kinase